MLIIVTLGRISSMSTCVHAHTHTQANTAMWFKFQVITAWNSLRNSNYIQVIKSSTEYHYKLLDACKVQVVSAGVLGCRKQNANKAARSTNMQIQTYSTCTYTCKKYIYFLSLQVENMTHEKSTYIQNNSQNYWLQIMKVYLLFIPSYTFTHSMNCK